MKKRYLLMILITFTLLMMLILQGCGAVKTAPIEIERVQCLVADDKNITRINEQVMGGTLVEPVTIRIMKFSPKKYISRYPSGKLQSGYLADETKINGLNFAADKSIQFFESGRVSVGTLAGATKIGAIQYKADSEIKLDEQGKVITGILDEETEIFDKSRSGISLYYAGGHSISFKSDKVIAGTLAHNIGAWGMNLPRFTDVKFYPSGKLAYVGNSHTSESVQRYFIKYKLSSGLSFYENGNVLSGTVAEKTVIDGKTIARDTTIILDEAGRLKKTN